MKYIKTIIIYVLLVIVMISTLPFGASAAINPMINYQGRLTNSSGVSVSNGSYNMRFKLYTALTGGSPLFTETLTGSNRVSVSSGLFSLMLGSTTALTSIDFNQTLYLSVEVGGTDPSTPTWDGEMSPRKIIGAVPAAFVADTLDGLNSTQFLRSDASGTLTGNLIITGNSTTTNATTTNFFSITASSTNLFTTTGNIGTLTTGPITSGLINSQTISSVANFTGTLNVTSGLTTLSNLLLSGSSTFQNLTFTNATGTQATTTNLFSTTGTFSTVCLSADVCRTTWPTGGSGGGNSKFATSTDDSLAIYPSNALRVGIGTTTPKWALQISSSTGAQLTLSDPSTLTNPHWSFRNAGGLFYLASSNSTTFATSTTPSFTINTSGQVGINTATPDNVLTVRTATQGDGIQLSDTNGTPNVLARISKEANAGRLNLYDSGNTKIQLSAGNGVTNFINTGTNFGINDTTPDFNFETAGTFAVSSSAATDGDRFVINSVGQVGIGTTTPQWLLQLASSTASQLTLSTGVGGENHWSFRNAGGIFYLATSSPSTFATSSTAALTIDANGGVTIASKFSGANLSTCNTSVDKLLWANGLFSCGTDVSSGGAAADANWVFFNNSGLRMTTTTNQVILGATSTSTLSRLEVVGGLTVDTSTTTSATSTSFFATTASSTNLFTTSGNIGNLTAGLITSGLINGQTISSAANFTGTVSATGGLTTLSNLLLTGSSTLQNFTGSNTTTTNATTTSLFATTASSTNLFATTINAGAVTLSGALNLGTNTITSGLINSQTISSAANFTGTLNVTGGLTTLSNLLLSGSSTFQNLTFVNATGTSATTTNFFVTTASTTNFYGGGLNTCQSGNVLTYDGGGRFGCAVDLTGANSKFATSTNGFTLFPNGGNSMALVLGGSATTTNGTLLEILGNVYTSGSTTLQNFTAINGTTTSATSTNFFSTTASSTNLFATQATTTFLVVGDVRPTYLSNLTVGGTNGSILLERNNSVSAASAPEFNFLRTTGTPTAKTSPTDGYTLGVVKFNTYVSGVVYDQAEIGAIFNPNACCNNGGDLYFSTAPSIGNPLERLRIDGMGRIGAGTTTPKWLLQLATSTRSQLTLSDNSSATINHWSFRNAGGVFYLATSSPSTFATSTTPALTINGAGSVGIRTASPLTSSALNVSADANSGNSTNGILMLGTTALSSPSANGTYFGTNALSTFTGSFIDYQLNGTRNYLVNYLGEITTIGGGTANLTATQLALYQPNGTVTVGNSGDFGTGANLILQAGAGGVNSNLDLNIDTVTKARLNAAGFGIGTTTPRWLLQLATSTRSQLTLSTGVGGENHWSFRNAGGNFYLATSSPSTFATSSNTALTIDGATGNVGIGATAPTEKLQINDGKIRLLATASNKEITLSTDNTDLIISSAVGGNASFRLLPYNNDIYFDSTSPTGNMYFRFNNGPSALSVLQNGNVGVGTTTPYARLSVTGEVVAANFTATSSTATSTFAGPTIIAGTSGNVGVGTANPAYKLDVNGDIRLGNAGTGNSYKALFTNANGTDYIKLREYGASNYGWVFSAGGVDSMYLNQDGKLNPASISTGDLAATSFSISGTDPSITLNRAGSSNTARFLYSTAGSVKWYNGLKDATNNYYIENNGVGTGNVIIPSSIVGIGTTTPQWSLQIASSTGAQLTLSDPSTLTNNHWSFRNAGGNFYLATSSPSTFATSTYSALSIDANGFIGIGTTTPGAKMNIIGALCVDDSTPTCQNAARTEGTIYSVAALSASLDLAESYPTKDSTLSAGEIVMLDSTNEFFVSRASSGSVTPLVGIVSTKPGFWLGGFNDELFKNDIKLPIALSGRVPTKVNNEGGEIKVGDMIALSSQAGVGKKATTTDQTVGIALQSMNDTSGVIEVFVNLRDPVKSTELVALENRMSAMELNLVQASTSLMVSSSTKESLLASVVEAFGATIQDAVVYFKKIVVDTLTIGKPEKPSGITFYDSATGAPFCFKITNGVPTAIAGDCGNTLEQPPIVPPPVSPPVVSELPSSTTSPIVEPQPNKEPIASTTEPSLPPAVEAVPVTEVTPVAKAIPQPTPITTEAPPIVEAAPIPAPIPAPTPALPEI